MFAAAIFFRFCPITNPLPYFRYELEQAIRTWMETDTAYIRKVMDEMTLTRSTLEMEYESLREECIILEKNHEEVQTFVIYFLEPPPKSFPCCLLCYDHFLKIIF